VTAGTLGTTEGAALLGIARAALRAQLGLGPEPTLPAAGPLAEPRGAFVTLRVGGRLRGCVGTFTPAGSLAETVASMAKSAAAKDPRFEPVRASEVDDLDVHVSVLAPRRRMRDLAELVIGRDGVLVQHGWHRGALLPQVAVEEGWDRETFLARACLKAGLPPHAWRDAEAVVELFSAEELPAAATAGHGAAERA
jgi:AmmeMemoRadiSam system protein A